MTPESPILARVFGRGYNEPEVLRAMADVDDNQPVCDLCGNPYNGTCPDCLVNVDTYPMLVPAMLDAEKSGATSDLQH